MDFATDYTLSLILIVLVLFGGFCGCDAFGTFGFDMHHRYSDRVKGILGIDDDKLPEKGTFDYFSSMAHRDRLLHGRSLADSGLTSSLIFASGNATYKSESLGFLYYASVSVGTPSLSFIVALDTGSNLFWLPCDCRSCAERLSTPSGRTINLNTYSPNASSTSSKVPCNSTSCQLQGECSSAPDICPYQVNYLSNGTSSSGVLVEDVLHLTTEGDTQKATGAPIKFGCGMIQTGSFFDGAAPNGLFGLGMQNISVPSTLASEGLAANSFSMCFGPDGIGRINFGDNGTVGQGETPFYLDSPHPTYNISVTQIAVGGNVADVSINAIFDSGTSFTYLNDPAYTIISSNFNSMVKETRYLSNLSLPFEFCYELSQDQTTFEVPDVNLTMQGGDQFFVNSPIIVMAVQGGGGIYCLALLKSGNVNIIGENFMTGYRVVFDREKMVLGWKSSDCYHDVQTDTLPVQPKNSPIIPPTTSVEPQATAGSRTSSPTSSLSPPPPPPSSGSHSLTSSIFSWAHLIVVIVLIYGSIFS